MELQVEFRSGKITGTDKFAASVTFLGFETEAQAEEYIQKLSLQLAAENMGDVVNSGAYKT